MIERRRIRIVISTLLIASPFAFLNFSDAASSRWIALGIAALAGIVFAFINKEGRETFAGYAERFSLFILTFASLYAISLRMDFVNGHPFPLYWSEGNRFYDYSTLFGSFRYQTGGGGSISAFITPGMALPWGIPFIFPDLSIETFRLYYQMIWIIPALALGYLALSQGKSAQIKRTHRLIFALWAYLFLEQGPIYTPLILAAILVVIAMRLKLLPGMLFVLLASYYAHISRWTWSYAPGIWAGLLALLEIGQLTLRKDGWRELRKPVLLGAAGFAGGLLLPLITGSEMVHSLVNPLPFAARQPLFWERLLPNSTYAPGIFLGIAWAALPATIGLTVLLSGRKDRMHWLQISALLFVLVGFITVGIIASAKIGGGSNLHNLDMFLVTIVLVLAVGLSQTSSKQKLKISPNYLLVICLIIAVAGPLAYVLRTEEGITLPDDDLVQETLLNVQSWAAKSAKYGEVLFIDQRQLLTFGYIEEVPLVQEFEKKLLMEMAMSGRADYFADFYTDLSAQRYPLIVTEPTGLYIKQSDDAFSEENNAFVEWVTFPLLCNYYPVYTIKEVNLELLLPRTVLPVNDVRCAPYLNFPEN